MTMELGGLLALWFAVMVQSAAVVWWASRMTNTMNQHSRDLESLFKMYGSLKDTVAKNEEAALNREIERLNAEIKQLRVKEQK